MMAEELQEDIRLSIKGNDSKADAISTSLVFAGVASFATMVVAGWELWGSR